MRQTFKGMKASQVFIPQPRQLVSPWVLAVFITSILLCIGTVFIARWTSTGPTLFPADQVNPYIFHSLPSFLEIPQDAWEIWLPTAGAAMLCVLLRSIPVNNGTRLVMKSVLLILAVRYFVWRTVSTLNFSHWASTALSLFLYVNEALCFLLFILYTVQTIWTNTRQRRTQAERYSQDVLSNRYMPSVDVYIPTYNEPEFIVRRTVIGCQAMDYANKTIYILDDTRRPYIRELAQKLGCEYITRPDNTHAKAGNLNNALWQTEGELIVVFDADFVPFKNFLTRTVGFFQNQGITLVQTKQDFYNPDYHARNLGLEHLLPNDQEAFYGYIQPSWDVANSVICCGTSYVVRRSHLEAVGGYYTRCCVEDLQTSYLMRTRGFRLIFLNETLSMGESTRTYVDYVDQRLRWLQGNLQIYHCATEVPIWRKLNWVQRSYTFAHLLYCFSAVFRFGFLITPLLSAYSGVLPYVATLSEVMYYFVPFILLNMAVGGWSSGYRTSSFWNEVYDTILCFPSLRRLSLVLRKPFAKASRVTRKGIKAETKNYNLSCTWPLLILLVLTAVIIGLYLAGYTSGRWLSLPAGYEATFFWLIYNAVLMGVALLSAIDQPVRRLCDRFPLRTSCRLTVGERAYWGHTANMSDSGASITLNLDDFAVADAPAVIEFLDHGFSLEAEVVRFRIQKKYSSIALKFSNVDIQQYRCLVALLYSSMTWWKQSKSAGGLDSLLAIISSVLSLKPLLNQYRE